MRRAPIKIDHQALERQKTKTLLEQDEFVRKLAATPLEKLTGPDRLLSALYRASDLFPDRSNPDEEW